MRLFVLVLFVFISMLHTSKSNAQEAQVMLTKEKTTFEALIHEIESQTDYLFLYGDMDIDLSQTVHVKSGNYRASSLLHETLTHMGLAYRFSNNYISLYTTKKKKDMLTEDKESRINISGIVTDESGAPIIGANVLVKESTAMGTITDISGRFSMEIPENSHLKVSYIGYQVRTIKTENKPIPFIRIVLKDDYQTLDEISIVGYSSQRKISVIGSISTVNVSELKKGGVSSVSNNLAGRLSGLIGIQRSGEPGSDVSEFWIRGISTFGANSEGLVLIDGIDRGSGSLNELTPDDIESFSLLKDATATAVYGARGGNGVILINTKRGVEGKVSVNANFKTMIEKLPRLPRYLRAYDYASLANEANIVRNNQPIYSPEIFDIIKYNMDPDLYPDVDWQEEILKKQTWGMQGNINIAGGSPAVRYYMSAFYRTNDAIYHQTGMERYNSNVKRNQYSFRSNIDADLTPYTLVSVLLSAKFVDLNRPGIGTTAAIWEAQANLTPMTVPVRYSNGQFPAYGKTENTSPSVLLNETGFLTDQDHSFESLLTLEQRLDFLLKGLKVSGTLSYDKFNNELSSRTKMPDLYRAIDRNWNTGELMTIKTVTGSPSSYSSVSFETQSIYLEGKAEYNQVFNKKHHVGALLLYSQRDFQRTDLDSELSSIPRRNQGIAGRVTYSLDDIYLVEGNFGYTGSENFPKGERMGFFPSIAVGYALSNYPLIKEKAPFIDMLKLRYSYGLVGNDQIGGNNRFPYLTTLDMDAPGYWFGDLVTSGGLGVTENILGSTGLVWEKSVKQNYGIDLSLWNKLNLSIDVFTDHRNNIFMRRASLPGTIGVTTKPWGNVGKMKSWGSDGSISYAETLGKVKMEIRANYTFTNNKIIEYDEAPTRYPYLSTKGYSYGTTRGLIALGLFKDEADVRDSPTQFGAVLPGDIKYQDVNGDGLINEYDIVPIGNSLIPKFQYGFAGTFTWKGIDLNLFFRGAGKVDYFMGGNGYYPFAGGVTGNVLSIVKDPKNRWTPVSYSGDPSTENPNAQFPRLTYGNNDNNNRASTFWLANAAYLRLKTLEIGYTLPLKITKRLGMSKLRFSITGDNLHVWDKVKLWDPEQASSNGAVYPLTRSYSLTLEASF